MTDKSKYFLILLVAVFSVLTYFHAVAKEIAFSPFSDFGNYWLNASMMKDGFNTWSKDEKTEGRREALVQRYGFLITGPSLNSLGFSAFMRLFLFFDFRQAALLWNIMGQAALLFSLWLMLKMSRIKPFSEDMLLVLFLLFSFWPIREALHDGQVTFLTLFLMTASVYLMKGKKWLLAGILLSLAIQTKEYLALSLLAFVWRRNWRALAGVALGLFLVKISEILIFGLGLEFSYWKHMFGFGTQFNLSVNNHSLMSTIYRIGSCLIGVSTCTFIGIILIIVLTGLAFFWTRRTADMLLSFFPFLILSFIISPWIHESHYIILYPAIIAIWLYIDKKQEVRGYYALFILAYLLLGLGYSLNSFPLFHSGIWALFTVGKLAGMIILFILAGKIAFKSKSEDTYAL